MALTVEAIYENGMLKPVQPLPPAERDKVRITALRETSVAQQTYVALVAWPSSGVEPPPRQADRTTDTVRQGPTSFFALRLPPIKRTGKSEGGKRKDHRGTCAGSIRRSM
jgi:predicted DNA-binding antitoxin AbrB/MazE fold protein